MSFRAPSRCASALLGAVLSVTIVLPCTARAQEPLVLRTDASLAPIAERIASTASRRLGRPVVVGDAIDDAEAPLGPSVVRVATHDGRVELAILDAAGAVHAATLGDTADASARVRAIVLSLESLLESVLAVSAPVAVVDEEVEPPLLGPTDGSALRDLADPFDPIDYTPRPLFDLRGRVGLATQRAASVSGAGAGVGVCLGEYCVVLDVDVLIPEEDHAYTFGTLSYVFTTVALGGRFLPLHAGPLSGGVGVALSLRAGHVWVAEQAFGSTTFGVGGRFSFEGALALAGPLALVLAGGLDATFNPTRFVRGVSGPDVAVFAEDVATPWISLGFRVCEPTW